MNINHEPTTDAPVNCPYCLTPVKVYRESRFAEWDKTATWQVRCETCWCAAPLAPTPDYAVDRWNELGASHWRSIAAARVAQVKAANDTIATLRAELLTRAEKDAEDMHRLQRYCEGVVAQLATARNDVIQRDIWLIDASTVEQSLRAQIDQARAREHAAGADVVALVNAASAYLAAMTWSPSKVKGWKPGDGIIDYRTPEKRLAKLLKGPARPSVELLADVADAAKTINDLRAKLDAAYSHIEALLSEGADDDTRIAARAFLRRA